MPLLQVRDFPENYYHKLNELSERENRSITQQTIYMLKTMLDSYDLNLNTKRKAALSSIHNLSLKISSDAHNFCILKNVYIIHFNNARI